VEAAPPVDINKNTEWFMYPGVWTTYILLLFFAWLLVLSVSGCSPGAAWTVVNLGHFAVSPQSPPAVSAINLDKACSLFCGLSISSSNWVCFRPPYLRDSICPIQGLFLLPNCS